jgi:hypothetical protein
MVATPDFARRTPSFNKTSLTYAGWGWIVPARWTSHQRRYPYFHCTGLRRINHQVSKELSHTQSLKNGFNSLLPWERLFRPFQQKTTPIKHASYGSAGISDRNSYNLQNIQAAIQNSEPYRGTTNRGITANHKVQSTPMVSSSLWPWSGNTRKGSSGHVQAGHYAGFAIIPVARSSAWPWYWFPTGKDGSLQPERRSVPGSKIMESWATQQEVLILYFMVDAFSLLGEKSSLQNIGPATINSGSIQVNILPKLIIRHLVVSLV